MFGHFGDRIGRKSMLVLSLLIMGLATFLIGLLPTYATIGVCAPILLVVLRFAQGFGVGGEWGGAVLMAVEHAPQGQRGFFGVVAADGVPRACCSRRRVHAHPERHRRGPVHRLGLAGPVPRLDHPRGRRPLHPAEGMESPAFREVEESNTESEKPIVDLVKTHKRDVLTAMGMRIAENGIFYVLTVFVLTYGEEGSSSARTRC